MDRRWTIRPATEQDFAGITVAETDRGPEPLSETEIRDWDSYRRKDKEFPSEWFVALDASAAKGVGVDGFLGWGEWGQASWLAPDERYVYVGVPISKRGMGVGTYLLNHLEALAKRDNTKAIRAWGRGNDVDSLKWAETRGYVIERRRTEGLLDLVEFDDSKFQSDVDRVKSSGIEIVTVWDREMDPYLPGMHKVDIQTARDVPFRSAEAADPGFESWVLEYTEVSAHLMVALALREGEVVGLTNIYMPVIEGQSAGIGYTGVLKEHRGKGIAFALKVVAASEAAKAGATRIRTQNDPDNPAILRLNEKLGFRPVPGSFILKKSLAQQEE